MDTEHNSLLNSFKRQLPQNNIMSNTLFTQPDILLIIGLIITILSACILLFKAFNTSIFWGLAYLFIPFASLLFIAVYWHKTYVAFLMSLLGVFLG